MVSSFIASVNLIFTRTSKVQYWLLSGVLMVMVAEPPDTAVTVPVPSPLDATETTSLSSELQSRSSSDL